MMTTSFHHLAMSTDTINVPVWMGIILFAGWVAQFLANVRAARRNPPLEIDHIKLAATVESLTEAAKDAKATLDKVPTLHSDLQTLKQSVRGIETRLGQGDKTMVELQVTQAESSTSIQSIKLSQQETAQRMQQIGDNVAEIAGAIKSKRENRRRNQDG